MAEPDKRPGEEPEEEREPHLSYTPASPAKRAMAWTGVAYMVIVVLTLTYYYATGRLLTNAAPLLAVPGLVGFGFVALFSLDQRGSRRSGLAVAMLCWVLAVASLPLGILGLLSNF